MSAANADRKVKVISGTPKAGDFQNQGPVPLVANTAGTVYVQDRRDRILSLSGSDSTLGADLASTAAGKGASLVAIQDAAGNFSSGTVEAALAEILSLLADQTGANGDRLIGVKRSIAGASSTTLHNWIEKHWISVTDFGAAGTGLVGDTTAIQAAIDAVGAAGGGTVFFPEGAYLMSATVTVAYDNIRLLGEGPRRSYWTKADSAAFKYLQVNSASADSDGLNLTQANLLAANVAFGASTVSLSAGKGANFTAGTYAMMASNTTIPGSGVSNRQAEFVFIFSKAGDTLTLGRPLRYSYTTAANAQLYNINTFLTGFELDGIGFDGASYAYGGVSVNNGNVLELYWCLRPTIRNFEAWELPNTCINLMACYGAVLNNIRVRDTMSSGFLGFSDGFGYAVVEQGLNEGLSLTQLSCDGVRHAYTTTERTQLGYGAPTGSVIGDSVSKNARGAGFDTHECGSDITFVNCTTIGGVHVGFQARCVRNAIISCTARDCTGAALNIASSARNTFVSGLQAVRTNTGTVQSIDWTERGAIYDDGEKTTVESFYTEETGGPGLQVAANSDFGNYRNGIIRDPAQLASVGTYGALATSPGPTAFHISDTLVHDTTSNVTNAFQLAASSFSNVVVTDCRSIGHSGILVGGADGNVLAVRCAGVYSMAMGRRDDTLSVAAGVIDVENTRSPYISVAAPGASANLDTINGGLEGCVIFLERNGSNIVVRDSSVGGGNIELVGATSFTLNGNNDSICLRKRTTTWREQWRADV